MTGRTWLAVGALAAVVAVGVAFGRAAPQPGGPPSSSYTTRPDGLAAYATLLQRAGHDVRRIRARLDRHRPPAAETLVLADGRPLPRAERAALTAFLRAGGRAVLAGPTAQLALQRGAPRGGVTLLPDAAPLTNRRLGEDGNAARALALAGPPARRVAFVESVHGFGERRGLGALPSAVRWCLGLLGLAALVLLAARGRRLGPPEALARELPPARRAHVDALAAALARTRDPDEALRAAVVRAGLSEERARALGGDELLQAGRGLARLSMTTEVR